MRLIRLFFAFYNRWPRDNRPDHLAILMLGTFFDAGEISITTAAITIIGFALSLYLSGAATIP